MTRDSTELLKNANLLIETTSLIRYFDRSHKVSLWLCRFAYLPVLDVRWVHWANSIYRNQLQSYFH